MKNKHFRFPPIAIKLADLPPPVAGEAGKQGIHGEHTVPDRIEILKVGKFSDERYGEFEITPSILRSLKKNFDENVRKVDLAIDYFHESSKVAAGWLKDVFLSEDGNSIWGTVTWTPRGKQVLADRELRYVSADIDDDYQDNETKKSYGPTLLGAGLTNRPVIKGMAPTTILTELTEGDTMTLEEISKMVKELSESVGKLTTLATDAKKAADESKAESAKVLAEVKKAPKVSKKKLDEEALVEENKEKEEEEGDLQCDEMEMDEAAFAALSDDDKAKAFLKLQGKMGKSKAEKALAEKEAAWTKLLAENKAVPAQKEAYMKGDLKKFAESFVPTQKVATGTGKGKEGKGAEATSTQAQDEIKKLAEAKVKDKGMTLSEAQAQVMFEQPALRAAYEKEISQPVPA